MKRRKFIKNVGMGTAVSMVTPQLSKGSENNNLKDDSTFRTKNDEYVEKFTNSNAVRSGVALGGIGTGSIELRKDGKFYNWTIFNNEPKGTGPRFIQTPNVNEDADSSNLFFVVRYEVEGEEPKMKLLQISDGLNEGGMTGIVYYFPWLEAVDTIEYKARFPFINMKFSDKEMPFDIELESYSPFIPHDVKNSSLPISNFNFKIVSKTSKKVDVMIIASLRNLVGYDTSEKYFTTKIKREKEYIACSMSCSGMVESASSFGEMVLSSLNPKSTYYTGWEHRHPYYEHVIRNKKLPNIDDTNGTTDMEEIPEWLPSTDGRNKTDKKTGKKIVADKNDPRLFSSLAYSATLNNNSDTITHSFLLSWNFPNLYAEKVGDDTRDIIEGHYYSNYFKSGIEVVEYAVKNKNSLYEKSKMFLDDFFDSSIPTYVLEQINSQLNTFITSGRLIKDGSFGIQEGMAPSQSWGPVATIDVALYGSIPTLALFPELQKAMMRVHKNIQTKDGRIAHGVHKKFTSFEDSTAGVSDRVDLPVQYIIMVLRDYFWTNDKEYLIEMWPSIKKAMSYIFNHLDLNKNLMPSMEGARSSYDNFPMFGLASYIQSQWLCAMASVNKTAKDVGDKEAEKISAKVMQKGKALMDKHLWNGKYYRLYNDYDGSMNVDEKFDDGCLTDQIIGQWAAHLSGLGYLFDETHIKKSLDSILKLSFKKGKGLRNASWSDKEFLSSIPRNMWVDQGNTYWTGVELAFASFLIYEGKYEQGLDVIKAVDDRYRKAGLYWDHQEFGGHYYRPMSAWAILNAIVGLQINRNTISFSPQIDKENYKLFFATPSGTSHFIRNSGSIIIKQLTGSISFEKLFFSNLSNISFESIVQNQKEISPKIENIKNQTNLIFDSTIFLKSGESIIIN